MRCSTILLAIVVLAGAVSASEYANVGAAVQATPELRMAASMITAAGLADVLANATAVSTIFLPTNDALEGVSQQVRIQAQVARFTGLLGHVRCGQLICRGGEHMWRQQVQLHKSLVCMCVRRGA